jgi:murein DD-endopeptidase MepM/ murein hydrolase activator NlpD
VLGHLQKGSVFVQPGDVVKAGNVLGRVGNSGNCTEPHLHLHVQDGPILKQGDAMPFVVRAFKKNGARVENQAPVRGDIVEGGNVPR